MNQIVRFLSVAVVLLVTASHLPAPITEVEEQSPLPSATAAPKRTSTPKPKTSTEHAVKPKPSATVSPPPNKALAGPVRFGGTWTGTINQGILGDIQFTLTINASGTSVKEVTKMGTFTHAASINGNTMTWRTGWLNEIGWTFTPMADGNTALVTSKSGFGVNGTAIFQKQ